MTLRRLFFAIRRVGREAGDHRPIEVVGPPEIPDVEAVAVDPDPDHGEAQRGRDEGQEGKGDDGVWKLKFPLLDIQTRGIGYFIDNYKAYQTGLSSFRNQLTNERFASKADFEREFIDVIVKAK